MRHVDALVTRHRLSRGGGLVVEVKGGLDAFHMISFQNPIHVVQRRRGAANLARRRGAARDHAGRDALSKENLHYAGLV